MKIAEIKRLVENCSIEELQQAESDILEEKSPKITLEGDDEGENLTHVFAAIYIIESMSSGKDFKTALREYTAKVRESIS